MKLPGLAWPLYLSVGHRFENQGEAMAMITHCFFGVLR
jgi:hypothetical protein